MSEQVATVIYITDPSKTRWVKGAAFTGHAVPTYLDRLLDAPEQCLEPIAYLLIHSAIEDLCDRSPRGLWKAIYLYLPSDLLRRVPKLLPVIRRLLGMGFIPFTDVDDKLVLLCEDPDDDLFSTLSL